MNSELKKRTLLPNPTKSIPRKLSTISSTTVLTPKGQLISKCHFDILNFPKKQRKFLQISALGTKKWSNQQSKATFL